MPKTYLRQEELISFAGRLVDDKDKIAAKLSKGVTFIELAASYQVPASTFKRVCRALGIELPERSAHTTSKPILTDLLAVVVRLAQKVKVNYDEIRPYLQ